MRRVSAAAALVGAVALLGQALPGGALDAAADSEFAGWLPAAGTVGETALLYAYAAEAVAGLFLIGPALALGYAVGRRRDLRGHGRRFVGAVAAGSAAGAALTPLALSPFQAAGAVPTIWLGGPVSVVVSALALFATVPLVVTVAAVAGVAVEASVDSPAVGGSPADGDRLSGDRSLGDR